MKISKILMSIGAFATMTATAFGGSYLRLNEVGYAPDRDKTAIVISDTAMSGTTWTLSKGGVVQASGSLGAALEHKVSDATATPPVVQYSSHEFNYEVDFSSVVAPGDYSLTVGNLPAENVKIAENSTAHLPAKVLNAIREQRSGEATALHPACHMGDAAAISYVPDGDPSNGAWKIDPAGGTYDMLGGRYDAGDYIKFTVTEAATDLFLMYAYKNNPAIFNFNDHQEAEAPSRIDILDEIKHGLDYLSKTYPAPGEFIIQVSTGLDHDTIKLCQNDTRDGEREALKAQSPSHMGITAAALALGADIFATSDPTLAAGYEAKAIALYDEMKAILPVSAYPTDWDPSDEAASKAFYAPYVYFERDAFNDFYMDQSVADNQALAAVELYRLTGIQSYLDDAKAYSDLAGQGYFASWSELHIMENLRLAEFYPAAKNRSKADLDAHIFVGNTAGNVWGIPQKPIWGAVANYMYVAGAAAEVAGQGDTYYEGLLYDSWDYIVGRNNWGTSFLLSETIPNSSQNIYSQLYDRELRNDPTAFGEGLLAGGPGEFQFIDAIPAHECADPAPPDAPEREFNTPDMGYFDISCNFVTMEYTIFGQSTMLYGLSSMAAYEQIEGCNYNPAQVDSLKSPPGCLKPEEVPMFISFGVDDNRSVAGVNWINDYFKNKNNPIGSGNPLTYDGAPMNATLLNTSFYAGAAGSSWKAAYDAGYEMGNHTVNHTDKGYNFSKALWNSEIVGANDSMVSLGIPLNEIIGFRAPRLQSNDFMFDVLAEQGFTYDATIQDGWAYGQDGTNFTWPYTLHEGSAGAEIQLSYGFAGAHIVSPHPTLWELPAYPFVIPPDDKDGFSYNLLAKVQGVMDYIGDDGKITGFDYNLIELAKLNKEEVLSILKHTLDLRLAGNRAPLLIGAHSINFANTAKGMSWVTEQLVDYAIQHPAVRVVSYKQVLDWIKNPVPIGNIDINTIVSSVVPHTVTGGCTDPAWTSQFWPNGSIVTHSGDRWKARWENNNEPGLGNPEWGPWENLGACDSSVTNYYGTINPEGTITVIAGDNQSFVMNADSGSDIKSIVVDGTPLSITAGTTSYTHTFSAVSSDHSIVVEFGEAGVPTYAITTAAGANGSISPTAATVLEGGSQTFTIAADAGFVIEDVLVDSVSQGPVATYTFDNVVSDHNISATFAPVLTHDITVNVGANGSATPGSTTVNDGSNLTISFNPNTDYLVENVIVDNVSQGPVTSYTFNNITSSHVVSVSFVFDPVATHTITVSAGANGSASSGTTDVAEGSDFTVTFNANAGYQVADILVDGASQGTGPSYTFMNVMAPHSISASFVQRAQDNRPWSQSPPDGLLPSQVPMFVSLGYDDNSKSGLPGASTTGGMTWATDHLKNVTNPAGSGNPATFDGTPARVSFYLTTTYIETHSADSPTLVKRSWRTAYEDGHEMGVHTNSHATSDTVDLARWNSEISTAIDWITKPFDPNEPTHTPNANAGVGVPLAEITGFRTPYLQYNDATFTSVQSHGLSYDNSIEEGWQPDLDGTNYPWPFTLDSGSPGNQYMLDAGYPNKHAMTNHPGLWEVPTHPVIVPPDSVAAQYGFTPGLRDRILAVMAWFDTASGKLTGFDYNMWAQAKMNKAEFLATLKYTLDLRLQGNRAPFTFGTHTDYYVPSWNGSASTTALERQEAIEEFVTYALSKPEVRIVPHQTIVDWMSDPNRGTLGGTTYTISASAGANGSISPSGAVVASEGGSRTFTFTPNAGFMVQDVLVDGISVGAPPSYTISNVVSNHDISVSFAAAPDFTITASAGQGGSITPSGAVVVTNGGSQSFNMAPDAGYVVDDVMVDGASVGATTSYDFTNVVADHSISASFKVDIPSGATADYVVASDWGSGFCVDVTINNGGTTTLNGWTVTWTYPSGQTIGSLWDGSFTQTGANVSVTDVGWNGTIAPGGSVKFGFCGSYPSVNTDPTDVAVQ